MKRLILAAFALVAGIALGAGAARAAFGWQQILAPCVPTGVALTSSEIAVACPGDRTVYIQRR